MFGKIMSVPDNIMWRYYELLTEEDLDSVKKLHPKEAKVNLAQLMVKKFHGSSAADAAAQHFNSVFSKKEIPDEMEDFALPNSNGMDIVELLLAANLAESKNEARRLLEQGGVQLDGRKISLGEKISISKPQVLKVGKRRFKRLTPP
jgi:tyrosyl-tRNA synthetase